MDGSPLTSVISVNEHLLFVRSAGRSFLGCREGDWIRHGKVMGTGGCALPTKGGSRWMRHDKDLD